MTNTTETPARIITEAEARIISQKLEYWGEGVADFACEASLNVKALKEKLETPTRANLPGIRADINAIFEAQSIISDLSTKYTVFLHDLKRRFNKSFTIWDALRGEPENDC